MADIELSTVVQETTIDPAGDKFPFIDVSETPDATNWAAVNDLIKAFFQQGSDVASAATISFGQGSYFNITGTTTITDVDFSPDFNGRFAIAKFAGILTLTHNGTTLILPTGASITTAAGDIAIFISEGTDNVRVVYFRASGAALTGAGIGGSTGATDNAILRADGTGGSTAQNSSATVSDAGDVIAAAARYFMVASSDIQFGDLVGTGDSVIGYNSGKAVKFRDNGGGINLQVDVNATAGNTRLLVWDVDNATLERVSVGAADSGGTGFKVLRIPN